MELEQVQLEPGHLVAVVAGVEYVPGGPLAGQFIQHVDPGQDPPLIKTTCCPESAWLFPSMDALANALTVRSESGQMLLLGFLIVPVSTDEPVLRPLSCGQYALRGTPEQKLQAALADPTKPKGRG